MDKDLLFKVDKITQQLAKLNFKRIDGTIHITQHKVLCEISCACEETGPTIKYTLLKARKEAREEPTWQLQVDKTLTFFSYYLPENEDITARLETLGFSNIGIEHFFVKDHTVCVSGFKNMRYSHVFDSCDPKMIADRFKQYTIPNEELHNYTF